MRLLLFPALLLSTFVLAQKYEEVLLWPEGAPGSEGKSGPETPVVRADGRSRVTNIHRPSLTVVRPQAGKVTGASVVICPGGGHQYLAIGHEGFEVAEWFAARGVTAFVLKYRLARAPESTYTVQDHSAADGRRALEVIRARAGEWQLDPKRCGMIGFSAGGEVAALVANGEGARPDFVILVYPGFAKANVVKGSPPAFLVHADDDRLSAERSAAYYAACKQAGVPAELHVFATGGHGFGLHGAGPVSVWPTLLESWLTRR